MNINSKVFRPACTTTLETAQFNGNEMLKQVQHDGKETAKGEQQSLQFPRPLRERTNLLANECELRNSGEGSCKSDKTDMTPHQVGTKLAKRSLSPTILSPKGEEFHDRARHEAAEPASCNSLVPQCLSNLVPSFAPSVRKSANVFINSLVPLTANNKSFYIRKSRSVWCAQFLPAE